MRRRIFVLIIVLGLIFPVVVLPVGASNTVTIWANAAFTRTELVSGLKSTELKTNGLTEEIPFWVDLVNSEDVSEDGDGVYIAVLDTGLLSMWPWFFSGANIADNLGIGFTHDVSWDPSINNFVWGPLRNDRGIITKAFEGSGHGTHVVSTIVGYNYNNLFWVRGVAPKATIIPVLVLDAWLVPSPYGTAFFRGGTWEMIAAGINYVADLADNLDGPVIISMSLGGGSPSPLIEDAIDYAIKKGVIVVAAAGNAGYEGMGWPGAYSQVISCAMGGWTEQWIGYPDRWWLNDVTEKLNSKDYWGNNHQLFLDYLSSRPNKDLGQKSFHLGVTTPGAAVVGPFKDFLSTDIGYHYLWGTSMATPHVSAIASLVLQNHPDISQKEMEHILKVAASGSPLPCDGSLAFDVPDWLYYFTWYGIDYGSGFLKADAALKKAK
jgi:subtilisin family serine protease